MNLLNPARLAVMMFLQFFVWGAWYVLGPNYLTTIGFTPSDFGWMYSVGPIAGIISPFFVGMIADRFFPTERVLGLMHLVGGAIMLGAASLMTADRPSPLLINLVFFAYMLTFFPTLSLTNSLSMHNLTNSEKYFPLVRVFGTLGWIVANNAVSFFDWDASINMFYLTGAAALLLGLYSFTLPHTPPPSKGKAVSVRELLGIDAFVLLKKRSFSIFMISSFLICIPLAFYYQMAARAVTQAGLSDPGTKMSFGQISEVFFMVVMPLFFAFLGVKWMLFVGMLAWVARYALFAIGTPVPAGESTGIVWMVLAGIILHGICYDFFFVTGQIYTDKVAPKEIRSQAQGMLVLFTLGIGMLIGAQLAGVVETYFTPARLTALQARSTEIANAATDLAGQLEKDRSRLPAARRNQHAKAVGEQTVHGKSRIQAFVDATTSSGGEKPTSAEAVAASVVASKDSVVAWRRSNAGRDLPPAARSAVVTQVQVNYLTALKDDLALKSLQAKDWKMIWAIPAGLAAVIMVLFTLIFHDSRPAEARLGAGAGLSRESNPI